MFKGSIVALITPFKNNKVDYDKLAELIEWHIGQGTSGIVPCGTTGESATLSHQEHKDVIKFTVDACKKRIPVIAGTGSNNTVEALELTEFAEKTGADGALLITPYYNRPTQEGLYRHFKIIAENTKIPLVLYNVPSRTGVNMLPATIARLAGFKNVVAVKEASGSIDQSVEIIQSTAGRVKVLSGDDSLFLPIMAVGGDGVISVVANVVPKDTRSLYDSFVAGDLAKAKELHYKLFPLIKAMFIETNPIPVKAALRLMGRINEEIRLPMCEPAAATLEKLKAAMKEYGGLI